MHERAQIFVFERARGCNGLVVLIVIGQAYDTDGLAGLNTTHQKIGTMRRGKNALVRSGGRVGNLFPQSVRHWRMQKRFWFINEQDERITRDNFHNHPDEGLHTIAGLFDGLRFIVKISGLFC